MISFAGMYTREEWLRGLGLAMRPTKRALILRIIGLTLFVVAIGIMVAAIIAREEFDTFRIARTGITALVLGYWSLSPFLRARIVAARQWKAAGGHASLQGEASNQGIRTSASQELDRWESYLKAVVREDMIVLLGDDGLATVLPRRFFADERDWREFSQLVQFKVQPPQ